MTELTVRWSEGEATFDGSRAVTVGRSTECDVLIVDERVSRNPHLVLEPVGANWRLDDRSRAGTYLDGEQVDDLSFDGTRTFNLGAPDGPTIAVTATRPVAASPPATAATPPADPPPATPPPATPPPAAPPPPPTAPPGPPTQAPAAPPAAPVAGAPAAAPFNPSATVSLDDRALRLTYGERELIVPPGHVINVGRDEASDLVIDKQIVSRQHARFSHDGANWWVEDLNSTRGTFVDGRALKSPHKAEGVFEVSLGDDDAGERIRVVTAGEHHAPKNRLPLILAAVALVLVVAVTGFVVANSGSDSSNAETTAGDISVSNTLAQLSAVKPSIVLIEAVDSRGNPLWTGSGTVIDDKGRILTNAHVADPGAASLEALAPLLDGIDSNETPAGFIIWVSDSEDEPAQPRFRAELVGSASEQDASIIQITEDLSGTPVADPGLTPVPVGSSDLKAGQQIHSLGYPENATTFSISVVQGEVISFVSADEFTNIGGDSRRVMNTSAVLGPGSSGGPVILDGRIVGLNFTVSTLDSLDRGWVVPISEIESLLSSVGVSAGD